MSKSGFGIFGLSISQWGKIFKGIGKAATGLWNKNTGAGLTPAEKEAAALSLRNQQTLNEQEYDRKIDFYNRFESPEAQVRQHKEAGLNPMMLATGGATVSASGGIGSSGSADTPMSNSGQLDLNSLLSTVIGATQRNKQLKIDADAVAVQKQQADTAQYNAETERMYKDALTKGQETTNEWLDTIYGVQVAKDSADVDLKNAQRNQLEDLIKSQETERRLKEKNIEILDMEKAIMQYQKAIMAAQSKYADKYFKALAELNAANALLATDQAGIFHSTLEKQKEAAIADLSYTITKAGEEEAIFNGEAFKAHIAGKATSAEKWQMGLNFTGSIIGAAAGMATGLGGASIAARGMTTAASTRADALTNKKFYNNPLISGFGYTGYNPSTAGLR